MAVKGLSSFRGIILHQTETMVSMRASTDLILNGILFLIYNSLHKVIQQVHATGPLVSHMDFDGASPYQYMRDKDESLFSPPVSFGECLR